MEEMTLAQLIEVVFEYDEYRPIYIKAQDPIKADTACLVIMGDDPAFDDSTYIPEEAKARGMVPFMTSGQIDDIAGALYNEMPDYTPSQFLQVLTAVYHKHYKQ